MKVNMSDLAGVNTEAWLQQTILAFRNIVGNLYDSVAGGKAVVKTKVGEIVANFGAVTCDEKMRSTLGMFALVLNMD
jgi:hypothetical protein